MPFQAYNADLDLTYGDWAGVKAELNLFFLVGDHIADFVVWWHI